MSGYGTLTDFELIALLRSGDQEAFAEIYNKYKSSLYLHAFRILKDEDEAKDVVQEFFATMWAKKENLLIKTTIASYVYGSVRNRVFNIISHQKIVLQYAGSLQSFINKGEFITDDQVREKELTSIIEKEIAALPEKMREVFLLSRNTDLSHKKIGSQLNISDKTVKKQVGNALKILRLKINLTISIF